MFAPAFHTPFDFIKEKTYQRQNAATVPLPPHLEKFEIQATARTDGGARSRYRRGKFCWVNRHGGGNGCQASWMAASIGARTVCFQPTLKIMWPRIIRFGQLMPLLRGLILGSWF